MNLWKEDSGNKALYLLFVLLIRDKTGLLEVTLKSKVEKRHKVLKCLLSREVWDKQCINRKEHFFLEINNPVKKISTFPQKVAIDKVRVDKKELPWKKMNVKEKTLLNGDISYWRHWVLLTHLESYIKDFFETV